ncbi:MAG: LamG domain-containing protein, partial [Candidatus Shapirobacteria bacterium]|nr:LamG domain-containing protein [Candidatus Shapirobacteria bacterium]
VMMMGYGNSWRRILPHFYTTNHDSYMYLGSLGSVGINRLEWSGSDYNSTMNNTYPIESGKGLTPRSFQEIEVWVRENEITLLTNQSMGSIATEELSPAPIAYWKFDEGIGNTAFNSASTQNNGIISGATWLDEAQCINGKCLNFDNIDDVISTPYINFTDTFTVSLWIKGNSFNPTTDDGILSECESSTTGKCMHLVIRAGKPYLGFYGNDLSSNTTLETNKWYHLTYLYDGTKQKIYINGNLDTSRNAVAFNGQSGTVHLGKSYNSSSYVFDGNFDDVKIYPYARTADQIKQDYNSRGSVNSSSTNLGIKSNTSPSLKSSLVAYYKFDEGSGTTVYNSGIGGTAFNGTFGTGSSAPTWTQGKSIKGLSFIGTNYITLPNDIVTTSTIRSQGVTYSAWIKSTTTITTNLRILGQKPGSGYSDFASGGIGIDSSGKALMVAYDDGIAYKYATSNTTLNTNQWHHIVGTYDPSDQKIKIYVNGKKDGSDVSITTFSRLLTNSTNSIGNQNHPTSPYFFNGLIDEVKIYNRALTDEEVKQDYNAGSAIQFGSTSQSIGGTTTSLEYCIPGDTSYCASPVAEWNFEENTGTTIKDTSGNNNNGTFGTGSSAPTWTIGANNKGSGLKFDGTNDYASATLNGTTLSDFSYELWFKTNTISGNAGILQWANTLSAGSPMIYIDRYNSNIRIYNSGTYSSSIPINSNTWYQLSAVYSAGTTKTDIYLNGILKTTLNKQLTLQSQGVTMYFGNGYNGYFNGSLDNVKIYNYARTPAQIAYDYNKGAPVGWWKMDECQGSTVNDSSGIGNTGVIVIGSSGTQNSLGTCQIGTSAAWTNGASGKINSSLNFDGVDDYISTTASDILKVQSNSFSLWIKANDLNAYRGLFEIVSESTNRRYSRLMSFGSNEVRFHISYEDFNNTYVSFPNVPLNQWVNLITTWDGSNIKAYINGSKVSETSFTSAIPYDGNVLLKIGLDPSRYFNGQIDDVRIYNYALTSEQVKTVYNGGAVNFR